MVERARLENEWVSQPRGFESHPLRRTFRVRPVGAPPGPAGLECPKSSVTGQAPDATEGSHSWSSARAWKARIPQGIESSNLSPSAPLHFIVCCL